MVGSVRVDQAAGSQIGHAPALDEQEPAAGAYRGEGVVLAKDPGSLLAELEGELVGEVVGEEEDRRLAERAVADQLDELMEDDVLAELQEQLGHKPSEQDVSQLAAELEKHAQNSEEMQSVLHRYHRDPSHQFLGLARAVKKLEQAEGGDPRVLEAAREALEELLDEHGPEIRAGLNTGGAAREFAGEDTEALQTYRDTYREAVLGFETLLKSYQTICERFGTERFGPAVRALIQGAADDMAAKGPSIDRAELHQIASDIYQLEVLVTVHEECGGMLARMTAEHGLPARPAEALMAEVLPLTADRWVKGERLTGIAEGFGAREPTPQIGFLRGLTGVIRDIPLPIYADGETRDRLIGAAQDALDTAIGRES